MMKVEVLLQFIRPELLIVVVVLWALGFFLKKMPWFKQEWMIPFILLVVGILLTIVYLAIVLGEGFTSVALIVGIMQGIMIAALAVFGNELVKQLTVKAPVDKGR